MSGGSPAPLYTRIRFCYDGICPSGTRHAASGIGARVTIYRQHRTSLRSKDNIMEPNLSTQSGNRKSSYAADVARRSLQAAFGLFICTIGTYMENLSDLGMAPWDALNQGLSARFGISWGTASITIAFLVILADLLLREHIGLGTILDAFLVGKYFDFFTRIRLLPTPEALPLQVLYLVAGMFIICVGQYFYMSAALCCGPRDALLVGVGKRFRNVPIGIIQFGMQGTITVIDLLLGSPVGFGTLFLVFGMGFAIQIVFHLFRFEPRNVVHEGLIQNMRRLFPSASGQ